MKNHIALFLFTLLFALSFTRSSAQQNSAADMKRISAQFPDDIFYAMNEKINYTFSVVQKGKAKSFVINENYSASFFTTEEEYENVNTVFYDDYSDIPTLKYFVNKSPVLIFPVVRTNYERDGIFHDDLKVCAYKMEMEKGKVYDVNYLKTYSNPRLFSKIYFHEHYPIGKKTISFEVPDWVDIELKPINFDGFSIDKKETETNISGKKTKKITYELEKVDAIPNETHSPSPAKYLPHLLVFVKSYKYQKQSENYFASQADVYKWCKTLIDSVDDEEEDLRPILKEITKGEKDSLKIMEKVFYWVQEHVRYIAFEDGIMGYKPMPAKKVCNMLYGDCKGMANLTKNLLKLAGIDARLTWIGTDDIPYNNDLPLLAVYNHMICTVFLGGKKYFLDATEDYIAIDDYAERIQGRPVMIENGNSFLSDKIPYFGYERNKQEIATELTIEGNLLKGKEAVVCDGEQKTFFLRAASSIKTESKEKAIKSYLRSGNKDVIITSFFTSDLNERTKPLAINYSFEQENAVYPLSSDEMLVLPEKDFEFEHLEFDSLRKNDYEFNSRYFVNTSTSIKLPPNYTASTLPAPIEIKNDDYEFQLHYELAGDNIKLLKQIKIKNVLLKKSGFDKWNQSVKQLKTFYHSPIVLKKA